jgi:hypothetical protein
MEQLSVFLETLAVPQECEPRIGAETEKGEKKQRPSQMETDISANRTLCGLSLYIALRESKRSTAAWALFKMTIDFPNAWK